MAKPKASKSKQPVAEAAIAKPARTPTPIQAENAAPPKPGVPRQLATVKGPYEFRNKRTFKLPALLKLDPGHQKQFVLQAQSYMGTNARTVQACAEAIADNDGYPIHELSIDLWEIAQVGNPTAIFEYWVLNGGNGEVFWAGEPRPTSVQSVQHEFQSLDYDVASHALAAALQAIAPR